MWLRRINVDHNRAETCGTGKAPQQSLLEPTAGDPLKTLVQNTSDGSIPCGLRVLHLRKTFGKEVAVQDSSFSMQRGELLALLGGNGSGKSTTCHVLCGVTPPSAGIAVLNDRINLLSNRLPNNELGWCPQHEILFDELTALEHVIPRVLRLIKDHFIWSNPWSVETPSGQHRRRSTQESSVVASKRRSGRKIFRGNEKTIESRSFNGG